MINVVDDNMYAQLKKLYNGDASAASRAKAKLETMSADSYNQMVGKINEKYGNTSTPTVSTGTTNTTKTNTSNVNTKTSSANKNTSSNANTNYTAKPEYQGTGGATIQPKDRSWDKGNGQYTYNPKTGYYESGNQTSTTSSTNNKISVDSLRNTWDSYDYNKQQELLNKNPGLQDRLTKYGITNKQSGESGTVNTPAGQTDNSKNKNPDGTNWDYQDNSQERMDEIIGHLDDYTKTNPGLFSDYDTFYNAFIKGKGRTPEQEKVINDFFKKMKQYNKYDNMSSDSIGQGLVNGTIPDDYLTYIKNTDPQRLAEIQEARKNAENQIMNESYLYDMAESAGFDMGGNPFLQWNKETFGLEDKNKDGLWDTIYHAPTQEELQYEEEANQLLAQNVKIDNTIRWMEEDLIEQYPDADYSTIMLLKSDRGNKLLKERDSNNVALAKLQGQISYLQNEREAMDKAGLNQINELQQNLGMYYQYTPQGMSELSQAQYAAENVTLDQADNGTDTQKQMALDSVLTDYFDKYGSIIQRSKSQVINDVMAYAKKNGVSLSQALENNFLKFLRQKPGFEQLSSYGGGNPEVFKIGEDTYGYWDENGNLIPIGSNIVGTGVGTMRTERNNNPTAMTTDVAKSLGGVEGVDYVQGDSFQTADGRTLYTAKLLGDPIETTIKLLDNAASTGRGAFYTKGGAKRWSHTAMSDAEWMKLTPDQKQSVVLQMLQREGGDINKMAGYNQGGEGTNGGELYNPQLAQIFKQWGDKPDTATAVKDFWNTYGDEIAAAGVSKEDFLKQYDEWYEEQSADAYLEILAHLDQLIELTGGEYDLGERWQSLFGYGDAGRAYDYVKNNLTVNGLRDAKEQGLKLGVLSDSDVKMIGNAATTLSFTQGQKSWNRELNDFREKLLSKNKYLRQRYQNTSAYSPNTSINFSNTDRKFSIGEQTNNKTTKKAKSIKSLGA